ncbi:hypothetical protein NRE35_004220 [Salmonella enterica]|nr:hypothetical protein [Escherichia coli]EJO2543854.1 hypothetical protein [Salmonella enterica]ELF5188720.1 hypothetical protein [Salmonella enterica]
MISDETRKKISKSATTHGMSRTPIYRVWSAMVERCTNPNHPAYKNYGGRGIKIHPDFETFAGFYNHVWMGYKPKLTLDRINNDGDYEPGNIRWTTRSEQANNQRSNLKIIDPIVGDTVTLKTLSERYGIGISTIWYRYKRGVTGLEMISKKRCVRNSAPIKLK